MVSHMYATERVACLVDKSVAWQAMDFISEVDEDNVKVHLDTYHMNIEENNFGAAVRTCGDRLG
eukprot:scaffold138770_cov23-Prasinocladus_malaysianus.AAC.1